MGTARLASAQMRLAVRITPPTGKEDWVGGSRVTLRPQRKSLKIFQIFRAGASDRHGWSGGGKACNVSGVSSRPAIATHSLQVCCEFHPRIGSRLCKTLRGAHPAAQPRRLCFSISAERMSRHRGKYAKA